MAGDRLDGAGVCSLSRTSDARGGATMNLTKSLSKASEIYGDNTVLRALINAIPAVGGSLDVILAARGQAVAQARIAQLLDDLRGEMVSLRDEAVDKDFLNSDEWLDLVLRSLEAATRTRHRDKIWLYARLLRSAARVQDRHGMSPEDYLTILVDLTPTEIVVARAIYEQQHDLPLWTVYEQRHERTRGPESQPEMQWENMTQGALLKGWDDLPAQCPSVPSEDMPFLLARIEKSGLIHKLPGVDRYHPDGVYVITNVFGKLMRYIDLSPVNGSTNDEGSSSGR